MPWRYDRESEAGGLSSRSVCSVSLQGRSQCCSKLPLCTVGQLLCFFVFHGEIRVGEVMVPVWGSLPGTLVAALFSFMLWEEAHR